MNTVITNLGLEDLNATIAIVFLKYIKFIQ